MIDGIKIENGERGPRAVATSTWSQQLTDYLLENRIVELELNDGKGWRGNDLSFLANLPQLQAFEIIDLRISSVDPIHFLPELRTLRVITYCRTEIRFSAFTRLEECALEWRPKARSLFDCPTLKMLFVNRYNGKDVDLFAKLPNLESLAILNAPVGNLSGISGLKELRFLRLANLKRLSSLAGLEGLANLEELDIDTCRVGSIEEVSFLPGLKKLILTNDGDIKSLKPLERLNALEFVGFVQTNIIDGDISPLLRQKNLAKVVFKNRRHYSHRCEDFSVAYLSKTRQSILRSSCRFG
jgi:Leucine-rich repeat (LRR) protein